MGRFPLLLRAPGTVCHFTSLQHRRYRLSEGEAEAVFVQPQFAVLIYFPSASSLFSQPAGLTPFC